MAAPCLKAFSSRRFHGLSHVAADMVAGVKVIASALRVLALAAVVFTTRAAAAEPTVASVMADYQRAVAEATAMTVAAKRSAVGEPPPGPHRLPAPEHALLSMAPPHNYKLEIRRGDKTIETIVSDGTKQWLWNSKFWMQAVAPRALAYVSPDLEWAEKAYWPLALFTSTTFVERLTGLKASTEKVDGAAMAVLAGQTQKTATAVKLKVWFDEKDHLPRRVFADDGQVQVTMNFTVTKGTVDATAFAARPPKGLPQRRQEPEYPRVPHGKPAPAFSLNTPNGKKVSLSQYKGKVVLLEFWAPWCPTCMLASPYINQLQEDLKDKGLEVLAVSTMAAAEELSTYLAKTPQSVTVLFDPADEEDSVGYAKYKISGLPSFVLIDRKGYVKRTWKYYLPGATETRLRAYVGELLDEPTKAALRSR